MGGAASRPPLRRLVASLAPVSGGLSERHLWRGSYYPLDFGSWSTIGRTLATIGRSGLVCMGGAVSRPLDPRLATVGRFSFGGFPVSISVPVVILIGIFSV